MKASLGILLGGAVHALALAANQSSWSSVNVLGENLEPRDKPCTGTAYGTTDGNCWKRCGPTKKGNWCWLATKGGTGDKISIKTVPIGKKEDEKICLDNDADCLSCDVFGLNT
ncbi:hypothetical protein NUU61_000462 [Penicillium alfredii]|uniref:Uncharacterized protein n=1 Tax=Penicillium alfredii TaxID=1506179 RepID=A0A9W9KR33_9EURO|nr:uncharacterized protein NUU61_000462 [Penicillium alfredii]KAJ5114703.1 hypothetical protein NUU61_000462 [Penicillium alfredii]